jgi:hypothetical protein
MKLLAVLFFIFSVPQMLHDALFMSTSNTLSEVSTVRLIESDNKPLYWILFQQETPAGSFLFNSLGMR